MMPPQQGREPNPLSLAGERKSGDDVRSQNVTAVVAIANIVKSSLGPVGLDKMLVDDMGDVTITNDGATILKQLEVEHPAAKVLVELSDLQDQEVGDGTTSVVVLAAELLKKGYELFKNKVHPTNIILGYRMAMRQACKYVEENLSTPVENLGRECLLNVAKTSLNSKIIGRSDNFFAEMAVDAVLRVKTVNEFTGKARYPIKAINILKSHGKSPRDSEFIKGYAVNCTRASQQMPKQVENARIALLDCDLRKYKTSMGVNIVIDDPKKLEAIRKKEEEITMQRIKLVLDAGANVVLTTKGIDDMAMKAFVEAGAIGVRRCKKEDLKRIAKTTGGELITTFADLEGNESFEASALGSAPLVEEVRVGDNEMIIVRTEENSRAASVLLRGPNEHFLEEVHRSLHDAFCVVKRTLESGAVLPGGGAVESALSIYLENFATSLGSREQLAIAAFAEALLVIPKTLAVNAAADATDLVAKLRAAHNASQVDASKKKYQFYGLDLSGGSSTGSAAGKGSGVRDNFVAGVLEPTLSKVKCIQFATEAAITIMRIDDMIKLDPRKDPRGPDE